MVENPSTGQSQSVDLFHGWEGWECKRVQLQLNQALRAKRRQERKHTEHGRRGSQTNATFGWSGERLVQGGHEMNGRQVRCVRACKKPPPHLPQTRSLKMNDKQCASARGNGSISILPCLHSMENHNSITLCFMFRVSCLYVCVCVSVP